MHRILFVSAVTLAAAVICGPAAVAEQWVSKKVGSWLVQSAKDPITDSERVLAFVDSDEPRGAWLRVSCYQGKPFLAVSLPDVKYQPHDRVAVVLRIDQNVPTKAEYEVIPDTGIVEAGLSRTTFTALSQMVKAAVRVTRETGGERIATFPGRKTKEAMSRVLKACPITSGGEKTPVQYDPQKPLFDPIEPEPTKGKPAGSEVKPTEELTARPAQDQEKPKDAPGAGAAPNQAPSKSDPPK